MNTFRPVELRDLRYFIACVEAGSLSRAAVDHHVAQPTLSHAIARLERDSGERLLDRAAHRHHRLRPTQAGKLLLSRARRALAEIEAYADDVAALHQAMCGELDLASIQSLNATLLPGPLAGFARAHPAVQLRLRTLAAEDIPPAVRTGEVDLAVVAGVPAETLIDLDARPLLGEDFVLIVRSDHPFARHRRLRMARLEGVPLLTVLPDTYMHRVIVRACLTAGFTPTIALSLESGEALKETVRAGFGVTILPAGYLRPHEQGLTAIRLMNPTPQRVVLALLPRHREPSRSALALVALLDAECRTRPRGGGQAGLP